MIKGSELIHYNFLHSLVMHLDLIGQNKNDIESIITEPVWTPKNFKMHTLCDLVILYHDRTASALELKGSIGQRHKAIKQIKAGQEYITQVLNFDYKYGLFVVYHTNRYDCEIII